MVEFRAASLAARSIKSASKLGVLRLALSMLDLTTLEGKDTPEKVRSLCRKAVRPFERDEELLGERLPSAAAVCVYPSMVPHACEELARSGGAGVRVASVATGFPSGQFPLSVRLNDVRDAVRGGADEVDMVINRGAFLAGRYAAVGEEIRQVKAAMLEEAGRRSTGSGEGGGVLTGRETGPTGPGGRPVLKVILETGELETYDNVRRASDLAIEALHAVGGAGGDFIKTSTGKVAPAATMPVTLVMLQAICDHFRLTGEVVGCKPAGGIRSAKQAVQYLVMVNEETGGVEGGGSNPWLTPAGFRFGASTLTNDLLRQIVRLRTGRYPAAHDFAEA